MTREEAIDVIKLALAQVEWDYSMDYAVAFDMAIKALEQESTTKNLGVDCIDRAELLKAMNTWDKFGYTETGCFVRAPKNDYVPYVHYDDMVNCVKGMPSVTPQEPKTGHWITQWNAVHQKEYYYCSECREEFSYDGETGIKMNDYSYCPNCGAKMVEPQKSEVDNGNND